MVALTFVLPILIATTTLAAHAAFAPEPQGLGTIRAGYSAPLDCPESMANQAEWLAHRLAPAGFSGFILAVDPAPKDSTNEYSVSIGHPSEEDLRANPQNCVMVAAVEAGPYDPRVFFAEDAPRLTNVNWFLARAEGTTLIDRALPFPHLRTLVLPFIPGFRSTAELQGSFPPEKLESFALFNCFVAQHHFPGILTCTNVLIRGCGLDQGSPAPPREAPVFAANPFGRGAFLYNSEPALRSLLGAGRKFKEIQIHGTGYSRATWLEACSAGSRVTFSIDDRHDLWNAQDRNELLRDAFRFDHFKELILRSPTRERHFARP